MQSPFMQVAWFAAQPVGTKAPESGVSEGNKQKNIKIS
jgi:hypothetical protein